MDNRSLLFMTILVLVCMGLIFLLNLTTIFYRSPAEKYLSFNDVRGIAVEHKKIPYTLNFEQQNLLIEYMNTSLAIGLDNTPYDKETLDFDRIIIYRFNAPDLILTPITYYQDNLIFSVPSWNPQGYLQDISQGKMKTLISQTYDP